MSAVSPPNDDPAQKPRARDGRRRNNLQHGLHCVSLGKLPKGAAYVGRLIRSLRNTLEGLVLDARGEVTATDSLIIDAACKWERHSQLTTRWLNLNQDKMNLDQWLAFSREVPKAADNRNRAIQSLRLDISPDDVAKSLYAPLLPPDNEGAA